MVSARPFQDRESERDNERETERHRERQTERHRGGGGEGGRERGRQGGLAVIEVSVREYWGMHKP